MENPSKKPELPDSIEWAEETKEWFKAWRESHRTDDWDMPQWQYMFDTAFVHSAVFGMAEFSLLPELRARYQYLGLTFDSIPDTISKPIKETSLSVIKSRRAKKARAAQA